MSRVVLSFGALYYKESPRLVKSWANMNVYFGLIPILQL